MTGNFVETVQKPQWESVEQYRKYLKRESPNPQLGYDLFEPDIECTCCGQEAPSEAAAMLKIEDETPYQSNLNIDGPAPGGKQGEIVWLCADCYIEGVRPRYIYFGDIHWNREGRNVKRKVQDRGNSPR